MKFFTGFVVSMYLLGALGFGVNHYFDHPEQGLFDAVARGLDWPGVLVEMARTPSQCRIKGNINSKGQHIYHVPGGQWYDRTKITPAKGEQWFCSEAEAKAAGWRKALR